MDFTLRRVRIFQGVNSRAELVTLAPGLRPERRFAPLARGLLPSIARVPKYVGYHVGKRLPVLQDMH